MLTRLRPAATVVVGLLLSAGILWFRTRSSPAAIAGRPEPALEAIVIAAPEDCYGALDFVDLLTRPGFDGGQLSRKILVTDARADTAAVRRTLAQFDSPFSIAVASRRELRALRASGAVRTPTLLLRDRGGAALLVAEAPQSIPHYLALADLVETIVLEHANP